MKGKMESRKKRRKVKEKEKENGWLTRQGVARTVVGLQVITRVPAKKEKGRKENDKKEERKELRKKGLERVNRRREEVNKNKSKAH